MSGNVGRPRQPYVVAHRGDSLRYRENTLAAIRSAVAAGADRVEIDVVTTRDGVSVVNHDRTLLRLWGLPRPVAELTWAEVAAVGFADVRIPRLAGVAEALAGTGVELLVDATTAVDAATAWRTLAGVAADLPVQWCGAPAATGAVRELDPDAVIHLETGTGYADPDLAGRQHPTYLNMAGTLVSPATVAAAHAADLLVAAWTVDEPAEMAAMVALGADAVTTNRPGLLRRLLDDGTLAAMARRWVEPPGDSGPPTAAPLGMAELARAERVAGELAGWAAAYLRESRPGVVATKANPADLVTEVDRAVERRVREVLAAEFPEHLVVGEEEGGTTRAGVPTWYVDPVDGTTNYAHGLGWSSVSLALAVDRTPLVGAVGDPWRREVLVARAGGGATRNGVPLRFGGGQGEPTPTPAPTSGQQLDPTDTGTLAGTVVLTEWAGHAPFPGQLDLLAELADRHCTVRVMGSGTLSTASVAAGRGAACVIGDFHPEDHLAATLIAREAGARLLAADGADVVWPDGAFAVVAPEYATELGALIGRHLGAPAGVGES